MIAPRRPGAARLMLCLLIVGGWLVPAPSADAAEVVHPVASVVVGDSYASGEGLPGVDPGEAECQRALGRASGNGTPSKAWGVSVIESMEQAGIPQQSTWFAACTSAATNNYKSTPQDTRFLGLFGVHRDKTQYDEATAGTGVSTFDVLLSSFGGNDLHFADVLMDCIGIDDAAVTAASGAVHGGWGGAIEGAAQGLLTGHCHPGLEHELRTNIDKVLIPNLQQLYDQYADTTNPGALIVVAGYPQFVAATKNWALINKLTGRCQGIAKGDADMLRGVAGRLNQAIGHEVDLARDRHPDRTWVFADVAAHFATHELCSNDGDQWINGLTTGLSHGDFRYQRSFHPTQTGHDKYAQLITNKDEVRKWTPMAGSVRSMDFRNAVLPANACFDGSGDWGGHGPITLTDGTGDSIGPDGDFGGVSVVSSAVAGFADFDSDGTEDVLLAVDCSGTPIDLCCAGRASIMKVALPLSVGAGGLAIIGRPIYGGVSGHDGARNIDELRLSGNDIVTDEFVIYPEQYTAAELGHPPDAPVRVTHRLHGGAWNVTQIEILRPDGTSMADSGVVTDDLPSFLNQFLAAWWSGDMATARRYATDDAIAALGSPDGWDHYQLDWVQEYCEMGSSGAGGCNVSLISANGTGFDYEMLYRETSRDGATLIYETDAVGGGE